MLYILPKIVAVRVLAAMYLPLPKGAQIAHAQKIGEHRNNLTLPLLTLCCKGFAQCFVLSTLYLATFFGFAMPFLSGIFAGSINYSVKKSVHYEKNGSKTCNHRE